MARAVAVSRKTVDAPDATVPADVTRTVARTRAASRSSPNARTARIARDVKSAKSPNAKQRFEPKQNRAERRAAKFEGRDNREYEAREHRWEHPEIQEEKREKHEEKRNNKRRESTRGCMSSSVPKPANSVEPTIASGTPTSVPAISVANPIGSPAKSSHAKKQGAPTKKQRKAEARAERRYEDDRQYRRNRDERDDRRQGGNASIARKSA